MYAVNKLELRVCTFMNKAVVINYKKGKFDSLKPQNLPNKKQGSWWSEGQRKSL
jgi:hypothetical protein